MIKSRKPQSIAVLLIAGVMLSCPLQAATDTQAQEGFAQARARNREPDQDHGGHNMQTKPGAGFHGIFYGYLPCTECIGIKHTLSLKHNNNYLLVTQEVREASRELYEKGKYIWDDKTSQLTLTPNKEDQPTRRYRIKDEGTLIQLDSGGNVITKDADRYILQRSDMAQTREVHMH
ncbi:MAG: copper resistance protein NlpE [Methylococcaceae bacterium]